MLFFMPQPTLASAIRAPDHGADANLSIVTVKKRLIAECAKGELRKTKRLYISL